MLPPSAQQKKPKKEELHKNYRLDTLKYLTYKERIPQEGRHILGLQRADEILVYQAYNEAIATCALKNQRFGGKDFSYNRMSWIKPNFLWMMYRCGWGEKVNQERILGIWLKKTFFNYILKEAVYSSFQEEVYSTREAWKREIQKSDVRLQWDPDHDVYGQKTSRRAIQLGLKGKMLKRYGSEEVCEIIDMTGFVRAQKSRLDARNIEDIEVPGERVFVPEDAALRVKLGIP